MDGTQTFKDPALNPNNIEDGFFEFVSEPKRVEPEGRREGEEKYSSPWWNKAV